MVNKYEITKIIEEVAPLETAEPWDMSGWLIKTQKLDVKRIMLCLTVTADIIKQAQRENCDMIISHHPLFFVPLDFNVGIDIYCAHTNLDQARCGTTETLIKKLKFNVNRELAHPFLRFCDVNMRFNELIDKLKQISGNIRYCNLQKTEHLKCIAFCAGSGTEFGHDAYVMGAEVLVTGDLKFHRAVESEIAIIDIGHFESEMPVIEELARLLESSVEIKIALENSPIVQINS